MERTLFFTTVFFEVYAICSVIPPTTTIAPWNSDNFVQHTVGKRDINSQNVAEHKVMDNDVRGVLLNHYDTKRFLGRIWSKTPKSEGYKRGPGFRSWGGKRSIVYPEDEKRAKFENWVEKRDMSVDDSQFIDDKRAQISDGGGKRKFSNWGGKRSQLEPAWRSAESLFENENENDEKRAKFASWGGKRSNDDISDYSLDESDDGLNSNEKRAVEIPMPFRQIEKKAPKFQSWGGKRATYLTRYDPFYIRQTDLRRFLNWEGKRKFSSWGGKRDVTPAFRPDEGDQRIRRLAFQSWGGKRDDIKRSPTDFYDNLDG